MTSQAQNELRVTIVQTSLQWQDREANLTRLSHLLAEKPLATDIIVLPEMFSTGFSMNPERYAEEEFGPAFQWMKTLAHTYDAAICGSIMCRAADGNHYNRLYWVDPSGTSHQYDKRHLFSFANEHAHFKAGEERITVSFRGWRICPLICYDLRFPVWSRNADLSGSAHQQESMYDVLVYVANWPEARRRPWSTLLEARAHENQCYVVGVNRIGEDGNGITHSGDSAVFSPRGEQLSHTKPDEISVETVVLDLDALKDFREKFTPWKDRDRFQLL